MWMPPRWGKAILSCFSGGHEVSSCEGCCDIMWEVLVEQAVLSSCWRCWWSRLCC